MAIKRIKRISLSILAVLLLAAAVLAAPQYVASVNKASFSVYS